MMEKLFNQSAEWREVIPSTSSLTKERTRTHILNSVRIGFRTEARNADGFGYGGSDSSVLYYLAGYSDADGDRSIPAMKEGDTITAHGKTMTVVSVTSFMGLDDEIHHLEVVLA